jgi:Ca-activated chloride channel family protein
MKPIFARLILVILISFVFPSGSAFGQPETREDRTLSPYFFVKSEDPGMDQLPLKSTSVRANISGVIADVLVTQVYKNEGTRPIEAIYVFPASTRAAVYAMKMTVGERVIIAKIAKREEARQEYEAAKQAGKSASLLEQQRPNVFQMNVANIMPSDIIKVELSYTELLVPTDAVYEFIYPTVVGPRYSNQNAGEAAPSEQWVENPYFHQGEPPANLLDIAVSIHAGLPIQDVTCSSHKVNVGFEAPDLSNIKLDPSEQHGGNRDFILKYRLAGSRIQTGLLLFQGEQENFFLLMLQPPKNVHEAQIPPREYIFVVDVSGSMYGFPLDISKKLLRDLISNLRPTDTFNVVLFAGGSSVMSERSLPATSDHIQQAVNLIERQRGGGGTELVPALERALALPKTEEGYSRTIIIATDGYVTVEEKAFDLIRNHLGAANVFAFGIGSSVNRHLIEGLARVGMGEPFVIAKPQEAPEKAKKFRQLVGSPLLTGMKIDFGGFGVYDVEPPQVPDLFADRPAIVFGKWRGRARGFIKLHGTSGDRPFDATLDVNQVKPMASNSALRYLWARHRIALLSDYNTLRPTDERVKEVTNLGLTYNLLTSYTSFVAVDSQVRNTGGQTVTIKQPLPLPQGVSDLAVGKGQYLQTTRAMAPVAGLGPYVAKDKAELSQEEKPFYAQKAANEEQPSVHLRLGKIEVSGGLTVESAGRAIEKHLAKLNPCSSFLPANAAGVKRELVFSLVVGPDGSIRKLRMTKSSFHAERFEACVLKGLKGLAFPGFEGDREARITVTLVMA